MHEALSGGNTPCLLDPILVPMGLDKFWSKDEKVPCLLPNLLYLQGFGRCVAFGDRWRKRRHNLGLLFWILLLRYISMFGMRLVFLRSKRQGLRCRAVRRNSLQKSKFGALAQTELPLNQASCKRSGKQTPSSKWL